MLEKLKKFKFIIAGAILIVMIVAVPLTLSQLNKSSDSRSRASGEAIAVILDPLTRTVNVGDNLDIAVKVNAAQNNISAVDITFVFDPNFLESQVGTGKFVFSAPFTQIQSDGITGNIHTVGVNVSSTPVTGSAVTIGTIHLKAKATGTTTVGFSNIHINASGVAAALPLDTTNTRIGTYTIVASGAATATPTVAVSTTLTPTSTSSTSATPTPSVLTSIQRIFDFNDDGKIDELDLNILYSGFARRNGD